MSSKAVILVGGPSRGTRFRPLSFERPKPLFPLANVPFITNHVRACSKISGITEILLLGFFAEKDFAEYISEVTEEVKVPIHYLAEESSLGTGGGFLKFRDRILEGSPTHIVVLHCDIWCSFPLQSLMDFHASHGRTCSILAKKIPQDQAHNYGCIALDESTHEILHYAEKPKTFVSDLASCGVFLFSPAIFTHLQTAYEHVSKARGESALPIELRKSRDRLDHGVYLSLEKDIFKRLAGKQELYAYETTDEFIQLKQAGMTLLCQRSLLNQLRRENPASLALRGDGVSAPRIVGNVVIHPTADVHPSVKLGDNVSIGAHVKIGKGVRIANSIILEGVVIKEHSCILSSIIGWDSIIGQWTRIEGSPNYTNHSSQNCGITIFGAGVTAASEIVVRDSVVLPHKELTQSYKNEILL